MGDELEWSEYGDSLCRSGDAGKDATVGTVAVAVSGLLQCQGMWLPTITLLLVQRQIPYRGPSELFDEMLERFALLLSGPFSAELASFDLLVG